MSTSAATSAAAASATDPRRAGRSTRRAFGGAWRHGWLTALDRVRSPNADARPASMQVELIVVHSISLPPGVFGGDAVERLFTNRLDADAHPYFATLAGLRVSAHFLIGRDGAVVQFVSCDRRAWHAGASAWRGRDRCNDFSIGVELEGLEGGRFEPAQYETLIALSVRLAARYPIRAVAGHEHVAPDRKHDPGAGFEWQRLASAMAPLGVDMATTPGPARAART